MKDNKDSRCGWEHMGRPKTGLLSFPLSQYKKMAAAYRRGLDAASKDRALIQSGLMAIDPYYVWAVASSFSGYRRFSRIRGWKGGAFNPDLGRCRILAVARKSDISEEYFVNSGERGRPKLSFEIPKIYLDHWKNLADTDDFAFTAEVDIAALTKGDVPFSWELAVPRRRGETHGRDRRCGLFGSESQIAEKEVLGEFPSAYSNSPATRPKDFNPGIVGVIDFGCPYLHPRFCAARKSGSSKEIQAATTRLLALWDQGSDDVDGRKGRLWANPGAHKYGRILYRGGMDAAFLLGHYGGDENLIYRAFDYLVAYDDPLRRIWASSHGAHVLDVVGGIEDPLSAVRHGRNFVVPSDKAGEADLVFVQLPGLTASDSSGASLGACILDGLHFILKNANSSAGKLTEPVVVNISYGGYGGPHDGSTMLERAMDALIKQHQGMLQIVIGAGNAGAACCHVRRRVRRGASAILRFDLVPGDTTDTFLEVWYESSGPDLQARVKTADERWSDWVSVGETSVLKTLTTDAEVVAMIRHSMKVPNGSKAMVLLAIAPTQKSASDPGATAPAGIWEVEVRLAPDHAGGKDKGSRKPQDGDEEGYLHGPLEVVIDAWIERDDLAGRYSGPQTRFVDLMRGDDRETMNGIATGANVITVGGMRLCDGVMVPYSSRGHSKAKRAGEVDRPLPDVLAVCEVDDEMQGVRAAAIRANETMLMNGTSVAAPVFARQLFNYLKAAQLNSSKEGKAMHEAIPSTVEELVEAVLQKLEGEGNTGILRKLSERDG